MRSTRAVIDLDALEWNVGVIRRMAPAAKILAMVKANGYGHGMVAIARTLEHLKIDMLGVAFVSEALELRDSQISLPIVTLTPNEPSEAGDVVRHSITTVIGSVEQALELSHQAVSQGRTVVGHLYVDTGMHRDGVRPQEVVDIVRKIDALPALELEGILTHFATADERHDPFLQEQASLFSDVLSSLQQEGRTFDHVHAANTGAIWQAPYTHHTVVRPGLSLHGYAAPETEEMLLRPTLSLVTKVLSVRHLWPGETVSYGRRFMTAQETRIATLPIGYGDGYLRALSGKAHCLIRGKEYPIVGTICMDECMVDIGMDEVDAGDDVVLIGRQPTPDGRMRSIDAMQIAGWAGTIPYEITTAISARVPRKYIGRLAPIAEGRTQSV
jgi:alanine racemase